MTEKIYTLFIDNDVTWCKAEDKEQAAVKLAINQVELEGEIIMCCHYYYENDAIKDENGNDHYNCYISEHGFIYDLSCSPVYIAKVAENEDTSMLEYDCICTYEYDGNNFIFSEWTNENKAE